jgi:S-adenosylmethionine decarboxylase
MCSASMDAWFADVAVLTDEQRLLTLLRDAGGATVVGQASAVFDNGAATAVLLLAESRLSVHTWPEHGHASFDVLTCGTLNAERQICTEVDYAVDLQEDSNAEADKLINASVTSGNPVAVKGEASSLTQQQPSLFQPNFDYITVWKNNISPASRPRSRPPPSITSTRN